MKLNRILTYIFLIVVSLLSIFPFFWMISGMTNNSFDISTGRLVFGTYFVQNIQTLFGNYNMTQVLLNASKIAFFSVILSLLICSMAAFGFTVYKSKVLERVFGIILLTMMVPFAAMMVPLFQLITKLGLFDKHLALILTSSASVFLIFFFRQNFVSYPLEVIQAGRIDGASELTIFFRIFVPSMKSSYFAAAIYAFMTSWNSYMWPLIALQSEKQRTPPLLISSLASAYVPDYGLIMTAIVISTLPVVIIFFAFQKQFVEGMIGSVKQ